MPDPITELKNALGGVNPNQGANPHGNCMHCAVETANALTTGHAANPVDGSIAALAYPNGKEFPEGESRGTKVYQWLISQPAGVYAVDAEDHAYNFAKTSFGDLYLIDSNQHIFRKVRNYGDLEAIGHNDDLAHPYRYHYADPEPGEDGSDMTIYRCGGLNPLWERRLSGLTRARSGTR